MRVEELVVSDGDHMDCPWKARVNFLDGLRGGEGPLDEWGEEGLMDCLRNHYVTWSCVKGNRKRLYT